MSMSRLARGVSDPERSFVPSPSAVATVATVVGFLLLVPVGDARAGETGAMPAVAAYDGAAPAGAVTPDHRAASAVAVRAPADAGGSPAPDATPATAHRHGGTPTDVVVRVRARDALLVSTDMGVQVTLRDADTQEQLARGLTMGVKAGAEPSRLAAFRTTLHLSRPRRVEAVARGPLSHPHAEVTLSSTQWVIPGRHLTGEGWVLELPGFVVTLDEDATGYVAAEDHGEVEVRARVVLMCGCPTAPETRWDADTYDIRAQLWRGDTLVAEQVLAYAGEESTYEGKLVVAPSPAYELLVFAWDPQTENTGVARMQLTATGEESETAATSLR